MNDAWHILRDAHNTGQLAAACPATAGLLAWLALSAAVQPAERPAAVPAVPAVPAVLPDRRPMPDPGDPAPAPTRIHPAAPARSGVNR